MPWGLFNFFTNPFVVSRLNTKKVNEVMEKSLNEGKQKVKTVLKKINGC